MPLLRRTPPLLATVAVLMLVSCKSNPPAADSGTAAAPAPSKAPAAPAPLPGPALSYKRAVGPQRCEWVRQPLPSGEPSRLAFDSRCEETSLSVSPDGREGLAFSYAAVEGALPRAWRLDFAAKSVKPLDLKGVPGGAEGKGPDRPAIRRVAFDSQGRPVALVADVYRNRPLEQGPGGERVITFEGQRYPVKQAEGEPFLALAYQLEGAAWKRIEAKAGVSSDGSVGDAPDIEILDAAKGLDSHGLSLSELPGQELPEATAFKLTSALLSSDQPGKWMSLSTPGGPVYYRAVPSDVPDEPAYASTPVHWGGEGKLVALEGLAEDPGRRIAFQLQGDLLLVLALREGLESVYVYDTRAAKRIASVDEVESALLWPEPARR